MKSSLGYKVRSDLKKPLLVCFLNDTMACICMSVNNFQGSAFHLYDVSLKD